MVEPKISTNQKPKSIDAAIGDTSLLDLQRFLADEFSSSHENPLDYHRSFLPLTNGLGLDAPTRAKPSNPENTEFARYQAPKSEIASSQRQTGSMSKQLPQLLAEDLDAAELEKDIAEAERAAKTEQIEAVFADSEIEPPPVPKVSLMRRSLAGLIDVCMVGFFWLIAVSSASHAFEDGIFLVERLLRFFGKRESIELAVACWFGSWFAYWTVCFTLGHATFGMWTWGVRLESDGSKAIGKIKRILVGALVFPWMVTAPLLAIRKRGDNLIDLLSGTHLYRSGA